jgi:hypothetical protein
MLGACPCAGTKRRLRLALTRFHAWVLLVDDIQAALAAHDAAVFVTLFRGFEGAENFHKSPVWLEEGRFLAAMGGGVNSENAAIIPREEAGGIKLINF